MCCAAQFFENLKIKRFLRVSILSIVFSIVFAVHAQAQTSYLDSLGNSDYGPALWVSGSDSYSVNFTATSDATITQVILNAGNEGSNSQVPSSTLSVGGAVFTFQGWGPTEFGFLSTEAFYTGSVALTSGNSSALTYQCSCTSDHSTLFHQTSSNAVGWQFETSDYYLRVNMTGHENSDPVLSAIGAQTHRHNESSVSVTTGATDVDSGDTLTYSASGLPTGLSINTSTGTITGSPTAAGSYSATVTVSDGTATDSESFTWTISANNAPMMSAIGAQSGTIGTAISITPMASDADSDSVTWSASNLPSGLAINPGTGAITGTPDSNQSLSTTVSIDDGYGRHG